MTNDTELAWPSLNALVQLSGEDWEGFLASRVEDIDDDDEIELAAPFRTDGPVPVPLLPEPGARVSVSWTHPMGMTELPCVVIETEARPTPLWWVRPVADPRRVQRRDSVRVDVVTPMQLRPEGAVANAVTCDLSEGGLRCIVRRALPVQPGEKVDVSIELGDTTVEASIELLRTTDRGEGRIEVTGRFIDLADRDADRIRKHIFAYQARQRALARGRG